jgi:hypothetical protein
VILTEEKLKMGDVPGDIFGKEYCWRSMDGALGLRTEILHEDS